MAEKRRLKIMGQKVNPIGLRLGINKGWQSRWYATRDYAKLLKEDFIIRKIIEEQLGNAGISKIEMERTAEEVKVDMHTSKPGMVIGRRGATINDIRKLIEDTIGSIIQLNIVEVKKPELVAKLVADGIAGQLVGRVSFRKAMKKAMSLSMKAGARGVKVQCSGRLGGAEMARTEWYREGRVPLHTLRADIDYGFAEANTTFGKIGVKVWLYLGDIIFKDNGEEVSKRDEKPGERPGRRFRKTRETVKAAADIKSSNDDAGKYEAKEKIAVEKNEKETGRTEVKKSKIKEVIVEENKEEEKEVSKKETVKTEVKKVALEKSKDEKKEISNTKKVKAKVKEDSRAKDSKTAGSGTENKEDKKDQEEKV